jgi:hypothetical protein
MIVLPAKVCAAVIRALKREPTRERRTFGRTLTIAVELSVLRHVAWYLVLIVGLTARVQLPPAVVVAAPTRVNVVAPHAWPWTTIGSFACWLETTPERVTGTAYPVVARAAAIVTEVLGPVTVTVPRRRGCCDASW